MANRLERAERGSRCSAEHAEGNQSVELGLDPGCRHGQWPKLGDRFAAFGHHDGPAPSHGLSQSVKEFPGFRYDFVFWDGIG